MPNALLLIVNALLLFLRNVKGHENCPDGICDEPLAEGAALAATVRAPAVGSRLGGIFDAIRFFRCVELDRVWAVWKRVQTLIAGCDRCPDGECNFLDLLSCIDLTEAVAIVREVLSIIQDSKFCIDDDQGEITLGQAAAA